jgi:hypothetical protein
MTDETTEPPPVLAVTEDENADELVGEAVDDPTVAAEDEVF